LLALKFLLSLAAVRATVSSVQGVETSGGIQSIDIGTKYRNGNTMHLAGESEEKKGWGFPLKW
jgi:hypothetical protein